MQSDQYPSALDIARPFREADIEVAIVGFHISGWLSILDGSASGSMPDASRHRDVRKRGRRPSRGGLAQRGAWQLRPVYDFLQDLPGLEATPEPILPARYVQRTLGRATRFDAGRDCPISERGKPLSNAASRRQQRPVATFPFLGMQSGAFVALFPRAAPMTCDQPPARR